MLKEIYAVYRDTCPKMSNNIFFHRFSVDPVDPLKMGEIPVCCVRMTDVKFIIKSISDHDICDKERAFILDQLKPVGGSGASAGAQYHPSAPEDDSGDDSGDESGDEAGDGAGHNNSGDGAGHNNSGDGDGSNDNSGDGANDDNSGDGANDNSGDGANDNSGDGSNDNSGDGANDNSGGIVPVFGFGGANDNSGGKPSVPVFGFGDANDNFGDAFLSIENNDGGSGVVQSADDGCRSAGFKRASSEVDTRVARQKLEFGKEKAAFVSDIARRLVELASLPLSSVDRELAAERLRSLLRDA